MAIISSRKKADGSGDAAVTFWRYRGFVALAVVLAWVGYLGHNVQSVMELSAASSSSFKDDGNAQAVRELRLSLERECQEAKTKEEAEAMRNKLVKMYAMPYMNTISPKAPPVSEIPKCHYVVLDFGANIGDTAGHIVDVGLPGCDRQSDLGVKVDPPHYDASRFQITSSRRNRITPFFAKMMESVSANKKNFGPEEYCYFGIEGNPVFTDRLVRMANFVQEWKPRPLKHIYFFTETVGAGQDGPTQIYLDTINAEQNYWGSSIFKTHQDVRKSAAAAEGGGEGSDEEQQASPVQGYTISTLVKMTHAGYESSWTKGHLMLKIDIEGGEYPLLVEAAKSKVLCELVKKGVQVDAMVEYHSQKVTGPNPLVAEAREAQKTLEKCGVTFRNLQAGWA